MSSSPTIRTQGISQQQRFPTWSSRPQGMSSGFHGMEPQLQEEEDDDLDDDLEYDMDAEDMGPDYHMGDDEEDDDEILVEDGLSSMSSSPSIPDENINFDLVYALHTFSATVEGQASVVKGDALVLMEDTNIYWWLVEVLKTSEIGYVPAENIETPYERLARLNKHRNVELASPIASDVCPHSPYPSPSGSKSPQSPLKPKQVQMASAECLTSITYFEVESEEEDGASVELFYGKEYSEGDPDGDMAPTMSSADEEDDLAITDFGGVDTKRHGDRPSGSGLQHDISTNSLASIGSRTSCQDLINLRLFAGNIGPGPFFHAFTVPESVTTEDLLCVALARFGLEDTSALDSKALSEYYISVQGTDGDDCILDPQDKPALIFKSLTSSLTTPMPMSSHKYMRKSTKENDVGRRKRSSSFSSYEQTDFEEDSVIRLYLHRRTRHSQDQDPPVYIRVSFVPQRSTSYTSEMYASATSFLSFQRSKKKNKKTKNKHRTSIATEIDRIDKIIPVQPDLMIGTVVNIVLEKFHVPDAEAEGYQSVGNSLHPMDKDRRVLAKYTMSIRLNDSETELDPYTRMDTLVDRNEPVASDVLFILRPAVRQKKKKRPSPLFQVTKKTEPLWSSQRGSPSSSSPSNIETRRPSILDILMDSPWLDDRRRASVKSNASPTVSERRSTLNSPTTNTGQGRSNSITTTTSSLGAPYMASSIHSYGTSISSLSPSMDRSLQDQLHVTNEDDQLSWAAPSSTSELDVADLAVKSRRRESSIRHQLKKLVTWGRPQRNASSSSERISPDMFSSTEGTTVDVVPCSLSKSQDSTSYPPQVDTEGSLKSEQCESIDQQFNWPPSTVPSKAIPSIEHLAIADLEVGATVSGVSYCSDEEDDAAYETAEEDEAGELSVSVAAPKPKPEICGQNKRLPTVRERAPSLDTLDPDMLLLVTKGVDYLQGRETSTWEDDAHRYSRPPSPRLLPSASASPVSPVTCSSPEKIEMPSSLLSDITPRPSVVSLPQDALPVLPSPAKSTEQPFSSLPPSASNKTNPKESMDDDELRWIVNSHIVF